MKIFTWGTVVYNFVLMLMGIFLAINLSSVKWWGEIPEPGTIFNESTAYYCLILGVSTVCTLIVIYKARCRWLMLLYVLLSVIIYYKGISALCGAYKMYELAYSLSDSASPFSVDMAWKMFDDLVDKFIMTYLLSSLYMLTSLIIMAFTYAVNIRRRDRINSVTAPGI